MPIAYDPTVLKKFFGTSGDIEEITENGSRIQWIEYAGPILKYVIQLQLEKEVVSVSGDITRPFGADSMYEFSVPCSHITAGPDAYYLDRPSDGVRLSFYYGGTDPAQHRRMTISKTPTGELKVWPEYSFPATHPYHNSGATDSPRIA